MSIKYVYIAFKSLFIIQNIDMYHTSSGKQYSTNTHQ